MIWPAPASFRSQVFIIAAASLAVAGLAFFIVQDVIFTTEDKLRSEAEQLCTSACRDIKIQYEERAAYAGDPLQTLPMEAQEISLKAISATVLKSYKGVRGGMYLADGDRILGAAYPTADSRSEQELTGIEMSFIRSLAREISEDEKIVAQAQRRNQDLFVLAAMRSNGLVLWTMRRAPIIRYSLMGMNRWWLAALVLSTLLGMAGIISIWYMLHSGVWAIRQGLLRLEKDFYFRLPAIRGDLGQVALAINQMAERRSILEEKLRQQDRLAALGIVVAGVAHEVRNPLNSIQLTLQLMERRLKKGAALSTEVQECLQEINRLDSIVEKLLAFGRPSMTNRRIQDVAPLILQAAKMVQEPMQKKNVRISASDGEPGLAADVDGPQIIQVLINLLLNAIDASPESGTVRIDAGVSASNVSIRISDEGKRIPDSVRPHIFDAYYTTKPDGTGLGLAVSREIAVHHGGTLEFESENTGTAFILQLPRSVVNET